MSKTRTITDKTLTNPDTAYIIDEQTGNMILRHFCTNGPYYCVHGILTKVARRAIYCALLKGPVGKPDFTNKNWHQDFADAVVKAMIDAGFEQDVDKFIVQIKKVFPKAVGTRAEIKYMYYKIASYAGQCATMLLHGLNPDLLSMTEEEVLEDQKSLIAMALQNDRPVMVVVQF
jgi:hypothetical protein